MQSTLHTTLRHSKLRTGNDPAFTSHTFIQIPTMIEDDIYRTSTQYRYWYYTREALASLRQSTNDLASERVRAAIRRTRSASKAQDGVVGDSTSENQNHEAQGQEMDIQTLTVEEELKVVQWGCNKIVDMGQAMDPPIPMDIRVSEQVSSLLWATQPSDMLYYCIGDSYPIPPPILSLEFPHDISPTTDHEVRSLPCHKD
jgi:hypothetical protein